MFLHDIRHALRLLVREPGFTLAAVLTLTLGVGANVAVFAIVNAALLRPLPYPDASQLVLLQHRDRRTGITKEFIAIGDFVDLRARQRSFESLARVRRRPRDDLRPGRSVRRRRPRGDAGSPRATAGAAGARTLVERGRRAGGSGAGGDAGLRRVAAALRRRPGRSGPLDPLRRDRDRSSASPRRASAFRQQPHRGDRPAAAYRRRRRPDARTAGCSPPPGSSRASRWTTRPPSSRRSRGRWSRNIRQQTRDPNTSRMTVRDAMVGDRSARCSCCSRRSAWCC